MLAFLVVFTAVFPLALIAILALLPAVERKTEPAAGGVVPSASPAPVYIRQEFTVVIMSPSQNDQGWIASGRVGGVVAPSRATQNDLQLASPASRLRLTA